MASFNQTFDFANWDQAKFDTYRHIKDEPADKVARFIINSPHYSQVFQALGKVVYNNEVITLKMFSDIIKERSSGGGRPHAHGNLGATATVQAPTTNNDTIVSEGDHNENECLTDKDHDDLVATLNAYFNDTSLFDFVTTEGSMIKTGVDIFDFFYVHCTFALAVRSLMKQYAAFNATQVLVYTKLMYEYPYRRIMETVQFVMDVMDPLGFSPKGCAIRSIQKLRLVHAMIRIRIEEKLYNKNLKPGEPVLSDWDAAAWGEPVNQQDMIFAIHTFSVEVLDALIEVGALNPNKPQDQAQIDQYYMMWHYIGRALGVMDEINPVTFADGKALQAKIYAKEFTASPSNVDILVPPLVGFVEKLLTVHDVKKVYSVVKYYNQSPQDHEVFKNILKIDLDSDIDTRFYTLIIRVFKFLKMLIVVAVTFVGVKDRKKRINDVISLNYDLLSKVIYVASDGQYYTGKHFRVADGFGINKPVINYNKYKYQMPFFESLFKMIFLKIWALIKHFVKQLFGFNKKKK